MLARALRRIGHRVSAAPTQIEPSAYEAATREKLPAPRPSVDLTSSGTPTIQVPEDRVTATPSTSTAAASTGLGLSTENPSRIRGRSVPGSPLALLRARTPARSSAETRNETALSPKKKLIGRNDNSSAAKAQPMTESASALARTSPFACWTFRRSTRVGNSAP
jgi:hypothetical protein